MNMQELRAFNTSSAISETRDSIKDLVELQKQQIELLKQISKVRQQQKELEASLERKRGLYELLRK